MSDAELAGLPVTVMGLGLFGGGSGVARWLVARGARVTVTDLRDERVLAPALRELAGLPIEIVLGRHRESDFARAGLVVANPAVAPENSFLEIARRAGVHVTSETELFLERVRARVVAITGTQGKSSTTSFTAQLLGHAGFRVHLGGNIGRSLLDELEGMQPSDIAVVELSSYQLEALPSAPWSFAERSTVEAVALVNVLADHLERHRTREAYARAKLRILELVRPAGVALLPAEFEGAARERGIAAIRLDSPSREHGLARIGGRFYFRGEDLGCQADLRLSGGFQAQNVLVALGLARAMGARPEDLSAALPRLTSLPHRLEPLGWHAGRWIVDNGVSTTPDSTIAALEEIEGECTLLLGGKEKQGLPFDELASLVARRGVHVVAFGAARESIAHAMERAGVAFERANGLAEAVPLAFGVATAGTTILFSPAAASFDGYANFRARAEHFRALLPAEDDPAALVRDAPHRART